MKFEKLLVYGPGSIGLKHINAGKKINRFLKIGVLRSREINGDDSEKNNWLEFKSIREAISWSPDLIIISTPANLHLSHIKEFLLLNIPILLEKPIGCEQDNLEEWISLNKKKTSTISVGYQLRFDPCYSIISDILKKNGIGEIFSSHFFCGSWLPNWREKDYRRTVSASNELGGGVVSELSHELDLCLSLLGPINVEWCKKNNSGILDINCDDNLHLVASSNKSSKIIIDLDFCTFSERRFILMRGIKGEILWDITKGKLIKKDDKGTQILKNSSRDSQLMLVNQIKDIINKTNSSESIGCSLTEGISVLELIKLINNKCNL
ncbi:Gfo/Idh/MocA family protein [Prochlorococcus marinus]|uniref:Gfo/Idh/MocA-like oxidoreductase N-terminal domain-containing protein n=1 Tax=Prochlorococcus marinus (strain MIT 9301) TaxID=167546 RepID=A3PE62_PROM0|nr:Gfo/Idh/MocA family oxidoreductase [Prochlorococcus marinus]ABO18037.1 Hypothetical protein P9301_14141 [Prochlorococcus marinus str. MIT 9301]